MRRRVALLALLTALALAGTAVSATIRFSSIYVGKSTQGIAIRLAAQVKGSRWFRYRATMTCNDGSSFLDDYFSDDVTVKGGRFLSTDSSDAGAVLTRVTGTLTPTRASGTIRIVERFSELAVNGVTPLSASGSIKCDSGTVKWSART